MQYRHELKHDITASDVIAIRQRMKAIASCDPHAPDGKYFIRSLYFDTPEDKALVEKQSGVSRRHKFRIRYYNDDTTFIKLEKKVKVGGLGAKIVANLTCEETKAIINGDIAWMKDSESDLIRELYFKMTAERLKPKTIVDYVREPFIYPAGNVRVTLDYDIRVGTDPKEFLNPECVTAPSAPGISILEVKWDDFLPSIIRDAVQLPYAQTCSFSKYEAGRIAYM